MSTVENLQPRASARPLFDLQRSLDVASLWQASLRVIRDELPVHSCSLFLGIDRYQPRDALHHVWAAERQDYRPATSLSVSRDFLASHRHVSLYTYSQIVAEDADAARRRRAQESVVGDWNEFVHLAFWGAGHEPQAVLSVRRSPSEPAFTSREVSFLQELHANIDAGLARARACAAQQARIARYEQSLERSSRALMLLDECGEVLYATTHAGRIARQWNEALHTSRTHCARGFCIPFDVPHMVDAASRTGSTTAEVSSRILAHPLLQGLSVRIEHQRTEDVCWSTCGGGYTLEFLVAPGCPVEPAACESPVLQRLSPAEKRVAVLVAEGFSNDEIAARLHRSRRTVEFQLNAIYRKLEITRRAQLVRALS
jgi:DNA-binding CsgD family transcriptional regulator